MPENITHDYYQAARDVASFLAEARRVIERILIGGSADLGKYQVKVTVLQHMLESLHEVALGIEEDFRSERI